MDREENVDLWRELGFNNAMYRQAYDRESVIKQIANNIEQALNSRYRWESAEKNVSSSRLLSCGFMDLFNFNLGVDGQCLKLSQALEVYIYQNEPRLQKVEIEFSPQNKNNQFHVSFTIRGFLKSSESKDAIQFNSIFRLEGMKFSVEQENS